jgi:hypothetical protein
LNTVDAELDDAQRKDVATLRARLALAPGGGFQLIVQGDGYVITRWNWTQYCVSLAEVEAFAARVEAMR